MSPRRLGQHFLADASWRARIVDVLRARPEDVWLEIGAGHGEMTRELARTASRVVAIEVDPPLVESLQRLARGFLNIEVIAGDILALDLEKVLPASARVYGNLPYYITSPILARLFEHAERIASIYVVIQLEVAARIVARPGRRDYGYLSVLAQFYSQPEILLRLPPGAFRPRPKVASALVALKMPGARATLGVSDEHAFLKFVQRCFAHKRKTLANNLRTHFPAENVSGMLKAAGVPEKSRAEELTLAQFAALFNATP